MGKLDAEICDRVGRIAREYSKGGVVKQDHTIAEQWLRLALIERLCEPRPVEADPTLAHCGWTPFKGRAFRHAVRTTIVSCQLAWHNGQVHDECEGLPLRYQRG